MLLFTVTITWEAVAGVIGLATFIWAVLRYVNGKDKNIADLKESSALVAINSLRDAFKKLSDEFAERDRQIIILMEQHNQHRKEIDLIWKKLEHE